jgi:hypothetical protein
MARRPRPSKGEPALVATQVARVFDEEFVAAVAGLESPRRWAHHGESQHPSRRQDPFELAQGSLRIVQQMEHEAGGDHFKCGVIERKGRGVGHLDRGQRLGQARHHRG